jgi:hypothetical protein
MLSSKDPEWRRAVLVACIAVGLLVAGAVPAGAVIVPRTVTHARISYLPSPDRARGLAFSCTVTCAAMTYHGGAVQHSERLVGLYWAPSGHYIPGAYKAALSQWVNDFAGFDYGPSTDFSVAQQYYDNSGPSAAKRFVAYDLVNGGYFNDSDAYPANGCTDSGLSVCLNDAQMRAEIQHVVSTRHLVTGPDVEYLLFFPNQVGSCMDSASTECFAYNASGFCAYHSVIGSGSTQIVYADMPWIYQAPGCDVGLASVFGMGYANASAIDPEVGTLSHEIIETMTDVDLNAWYTTNTSGEIGDKCAYNYNGTTYGSHTGLSFNGLGYYNQVAGDQYLMQTEFSNRNSNGSTTGCIGKDTDTQPLVSVSPTTATHGISQTFTALVNDPAGVAYIIWSFGDGTSSATTTGTSLSHTYATAGTKTLTLIATDTHGNERRVAISITVS